MFLFGDSLKSCCVAIVVPDEEVLLKWASDNGRKGATLQELCQDEVGIIVCLFLDHVFTLFAIIGSEKTDF